MSSPGESGSPVATPRSRHKKEKERETTSKRSKKTRRKDKDPLSIASSSSSSPATASTSSHRRRKSKDDEIDRSDWTRRALEESPDIADLKRRIDPTHRAIDFARIYSRIKKSTTVSEPEVLALINQYFVSEGLSSVSETLKTESRRPFPVFNPSDQRLVVLLKMVISWTENLWDLSGESIAGFTSTSKKANWLEKVEDILNEAKLLSSGAGALRSGGAENSIWDEDENDNIIWENDKGQELTPEKKVELEGSGRSFVLRAANLNQLVILLTPPGSLNNQYIKLFLLTYPSFVNPEGLFLKLRQRYTVPQHEDEDPVKYSSRKLPIQLRVINFLKQWIETSYFDLSPRFFRGLNEFVDEALIKDHPSQVNAIRKILQKKEVSAASFLSEEVGLLSIFSFNEPPPTPIIPKGSRLFRPDLDVMSIDAKELARQLTLIEFHLFHRIRPSEFLNQSWSKPKLKHRSPNLLAMIEHFNNLSTWVSSMILSPIRLKNRVKVWRKFIHVAQSLRELRNYNSMMSVLSGFSNAVVYRLKHARAEIPPLDQAAWAEMNDLMDSDGGFATYRSMLEKSVTPCIPYVGVFLTDLTFTEEGNENQYKDLINFTKRRLVGRIIEKIVNFQKMGYNIHPIEQIQTILKDPKPLYNEDMQIKYSLLREPRKATRDSLR
eukprot:TRINITY_DN1123_c2_g5_i1.p1 TRINITY_DN1123_c2_g5~~TRINITY_DN1123_c2_g5_i1.p1  ORF type:complete len:664 (-),score=149.08 TRINITY_DN1123_c2_g5_i1:283-2274(-)